MSPIDSITFFGHGGRHIGMGHLARIDALTRTFRERLPSAAIRVVVPDYEEGVDYLRKGAAGFSDIVVVDRSFAERDRLPEEFTESDVAIFDCLKNPPKRLEEARGRSKVVVTIDDSDNGTGTVDMSFNPLYWPKVARNEQGRFFGDPLYMPLRDEFRDCRGTYDVNGSAARNRKKRVLVLQGGADGWNGLTRVVKMIASARSDVVVVPVAGSAYAHADDMARTMKDVEIEVDFRRNVSNMPELMQGCDAAISGCGVSIFELLCLGVPTMAMTDEEKELETAARLAELGCVLNGGRISELTEEAMRTALCRILEDRYLRGSLSKRAMEEVDGRGAARVVKAIEDRFSEVNR